MGHGMSLAKTMLGGSTEPKDDPGNGVPGPSAYTQNNPNVSIPGFIIKQDTTVVLKEQNKNKEPLGPPAKSKALLKRLDSDQMEPTLLSQLFTLIRGKWFPLWLLGNLGVTLNFLWTFYGFWGFISKGFWGYWLRIS